MVKVNEWPAEAQRFYAGMAESLAVNGSVIVHPNDLEIADELDAAAREWRMPSAAVLKRLRDRYTLLWRVGRKVPLNVYEGNRPVCQCHTVEDAARIVAAMNRTRETAP